MINILYKIRKYKFMIFLCFLVVFAWILILSDFRDNQIKAEIIENKYKDPYIIITKWSAIIKRKSIIKLSVKNKENIFVWDKIRTFDDSNATLFWPDGSITRLWSKTAMTIDEIMINKKTASYNIKFNLEEWKTWSNIIKYLKKDSSFTESYDYWNYAATVRWTIFEMNIDNNYVHAVNHDVKIIDYKESDKNYIVAEWQALNMMHPQDNVPNEVWDSEWIDENMKLDKIFLQWILSDFKNSLNSALKKDNIWSRFVSYLKNLFHIWNSSYIKDLWTSFLNWNWFDQEEFNKKYLSLSSKEKYILSQGIWWLYDRIHALPNNENTVSYKASLRDILISSSENKIERDRLLKDYIKLDLFDYVEIKDSPNSTDSKLLKRNIDKYIWDLSDPVAINDVLNSFSENALKSIWIDFEKLSEESDLIIERLKDPEVQNKLKNDITNKAQQIKNSILK